MDQQRQLHSAHDWPGEIHRVCDAFAAAWKGDQRPAIEEHLEKFPEPHRSQLLRELLLIECAHRFGPYDTFPMHEFMSRFPDHVTVVREVLTASSGAEAQDVQDMPVSDDSSQDGSLEGIGKYLAAPRALAIAAIAAVLLACLAWVLVN